jgi:hypothetical protein
MPGPYSGVPKGLAFYGSILGAAFEGATTAEVWDAIRSAAYNTAAAVAGLSAGAAAANPLVAAQAAVYLAGIGIQDVNQMRAIAGQTVAATRALAGAQPEQAIGPEMIGIPPVLGTGPGTGLPQAYSLRVQYTGIDVAGNEITDWYTIYGIDPNVTVGDLYDLANADAQARVDAGTDTPPVATLSSVNQIVLMQV